MEENRWWCKRMEAFAVTSVYRYLMIWDGRINHIGHIMVSVLVVDAFSSSLPTKFFFKR